jgi:hypothetical protein
MAGGNSSLRGKRGGFKDWDSAKGKVLSTQYLVLGTYSSIPQGLAKPQCPSPFLPQTALFSPPLGKTRPFVVIMVLEGEKPGESITDA